jgi:hypothetical protein
MFLNRCGIRAQFKTSRATLAGVPLFPTGHHTTHAEVDGISAITP